MPWSREALRQVGGEQTSDVLEHNCQSIIVCVARGAHVYTTAFCIRRHMCAQEHECTGACVHECVCGVQASMCMRVCLCVETLKTAFTVVS